MSIKQTILVSLAGGAMCAVGVVGFAVGHHSAPMQSSIATVAQPEGAAPTQDMMKQMMAEQAKLAPEHKHLLPMVGTWDAELSFLMEPGGEPEVSKGVCVNTMILGGRFMKSDFKAEINMFGDKVAFSGFGLMGYGKEKGEFVSTWCDSMSTNLLVSTGKPGDDAKRLSLTGMSSSPMGEVPMKNVYIIESDKAHTMEFWQGMPGTDELMKIGWIKYTKKG